MGHSAKIGQVFGTMEIIDSRTIKTDRGTEHSEYQIRCTKCGTVRWHNSYTVLRGRANCYVCNPLQRRYLSKGERDAYPDKLYSVYRGMVRRCTQETSDKWQFYGARGIRVCDEWMQDYEAFGDWAMNNGWNEHMTLDRIDIDGDYEPSNCRWVDMKVQNNNKRNNIHVEYEGRDYTLAQFCEATGSKYDRARYLIFRKGYTADEALVIMSGEAV